MFDRKLKPSAWYYILALLLPIWACIGTGFLVDQNVPNLPGALEATGIDNLTQVVVPGSAEIYFSQAGAYAVYYEYRSVFDGIRYVGEKEPPSLSCHLISKSTGETIAMTYDYVEGNVYKTQNAERVGVLIMSISIDQPGAYKFKCSYPDGRSEPQIVLAVGPNILWEIFNITLKPIAALALGIPLIGIAIIAAVTITVIVAYKRHQSKMEISSLEKTLIQLERN
jgi:hypothetical protein